MKQKKSRHHGAGTESYRPKVESNAQSSESVSASTSAGSFDSADSSDTDTSAQHQVRRESSPDDNGKRRVRISTRRNKLHKVESHNEFSAKERGNYWWSDREKDRMMAKHERLVAKYEQQRSATKSGTSKKLPADKLGSYRGLESWTAAGSLKLDHTIEQCITAVMDEQDRQWNENDDNADIIAEKSFAVTEDSARRARLNGLQDAQEALRIRGESWSKKNSGDEISVGSAISTGTAAIAKKKKRSKLLARLDDSSKILKKSSIKEDEDFLADLKKEAKKKKSKKTKKEKGKKIKKTKSRDKDDESTRRSREPDDGDTSTTQPNTVASYIDEAPINAVAVPVSPLSTPRGTSEIYPILAALRQEQEKLKQNSNSTRSLEESPRTSIYDQESDLGRDNDEDDIVKLLREQQKKQSVNWSSKSRASDPGEGGNQGIPTRSGEPASKPSRSREDNNRSNAEQANMSDPPGRRPRRVASKHVLSDKSDKGKNEEIDFSDSSPLLQDGKDSSPGKRSNFLNRDGSGKMGLGALRNGAKTLFKKGAKV